MLCCASLLKANVFHRYIWYFLLGFLVKHIYCLFFTTFTKEFSQYYFLCTVNTLTLNYVAYFKALNGLKVLLKFCVLKFKSKVCYSHHPHHKSSTDLVFILNLPQFKEPWKPFLKHFNTPKSVFPLNGFRYFNPFLNPRAKNKYKEQVKKK